MIDQSIALMVQSLVKLPSFFPFSQGSSGLDGNNNKDQDVLKRLKYNDYKIETIHSSSSSSRRYYKESVLDYLSRRETHYNCKSVHYHNNNTTTTVTSQQREITFQNTDKVFASAFVSDNEILLSTKDNQLILLDTRSGKKIYLPVLYDNVVIDSTKPSGLYGVECNYDKSVFATGTGDNSMMALYSIPEMAPYSVLKGHKDLVFCIDWFMQGGDVLVSGSRDTKVGVWKTTSSTATANAATTTAARENMEKLEIVEPMLMLDGHGCKVRAVKSSGNDVVSLGSNGLLNVWDISSGSGRKKRESYQLVNGIDSLCMDVSSSSSSSCSSSSSSVNGLYAVGSQSTVSLLDFRMSRACLHVFESLDETFGVRSLKFSAQKNLLTVGGGLGRIGFYDLRSCKYIEQNGSGRSRLYLRSGTGWIDNTSTATTTTPPVTSHAIYTMAYNESNTSLFTAGGPLPFGAKGSYAALWD